MRIQNSRFFFLNALAYVHAKQAFNSGVNFFVKFQFKKFNLFKYFHWPNLLNLILCHHSYLINDRFGVINNF